MDIVDKIESFIKKINVEAEHMLKTPFWIKEIYPEADEAMLIAALCHDIERCFPLRDGEIKPPKTGDDRKDEEYLKWHGNRSAEFTEQLLREYGFEDKVAMSRIKMLIAGHSFSGTKEQDAMRDADSISLLENSAEMFLKEGKEKLDAEYDRLSSEKARELAKPFYNKLIDNLLNKG